jgi:hypothetical protein
MNGGSDEVFGKDADHMSEEEVQKLNGGSMGGMSVRKATAEEEAQGIKIVYVVAGPPPGQA